MIAAGSPAPVKCELMSCANPDVVEIEHYQRGPMILCRNHAKEVERVNRRRRRLVR